jgi:hypothetical protein
MYIVNHKEIKLNIDSESICCAGLEMYAISKYAL